MSVKENVGVTGFWVLSKTVYEFICPLSEAVLHIVSGKRLVRERCSLCNTSVPTAYKPPGNYFKIYS